MSETALAQGAKIVAIGGGTGTFMLLSALRPYANHLTAIVTMSDDGGSTGILRDELGALPPGDVRQCLVALSDTPDYMRELFNYRFEEGGLQGHAFGNLLLTALEKVSGSFTEGVKLAEQILNVQGRVIPVVTKDVRLIATAADGKEVKTEQAIREHHFNGGRPVVRLEPKTAANPEALAAIAAADIVVVGPGDLHPSLIPALLPTGMREALMSTNAKRVFVSNLVNKPYSTQGMQVHDYVDEITKHIGAEVFDYLIYNTAMPTAALAEKYLREGEVPVPYDEAILFHQPYRTIGEPLLAGGVEQSAGDTLIERSLIRHDGNHLAKIIMRIYFS